MLLIAAALAAGATAASEPFLHPPAADAITLGSRLLFTALVVVIVPVYYVKHGPANFLWFSDIALFGICAALWLESPLVGSMMALAALLPETVWVLSFLTGVLLRGRGVTTLAAYMFDHGIPRYLRALSLFHLALPPALLWLLYRYGYDPRALPAQTLLAWVVLPVTYWLAPAEKNINWVRGFGHPPRSPLGPRVHFALTFAVYPLLVYLPTHFLLSAIF